MNGTLALEDGAVFRGRNVGARGTATGEVVFNTAMAGEQEVLTDPSYCGQIVTMTSPMVGNYGVTSADAESRSSFLSGFVVRELVRRHSNWRSEESLAHFLEQRGIVAVEGIDTRALTKRVRVHGSLRGAISSEIADPRELIALAVSSPPMGGRKLVGEVSAESSGAWMDGIPDGAPGSRASAVKPLNVVTIDCGVKRSILRHLSLRGCRVRVVPWSTGPEEVLAGRPDGVLVGNGPGDPAPVVETIDTLRSLVGKVPLFGICLGQQLLALALRAETRKLKFGHHGVNHPVHNLASGRVEITSQNHGFAVLEESLQHAGAVVTHRNLNDGSVEGFAHSSEPIFAVQYHPEAAPGPHDSTYLFDAFTDMLRTGRVTVG